MKEEKLIVPAILRLHRKTNQEVAILSPQLLNTSNLINLVVFSCAGMLKVSNDTILTARHFSSTELHTIQAYSGLYLDSGKSVGSEDAIEPAEKIFRIWGYQTLQKWIIAYPRTEDIIGFQNPEVITLDLPLSMVEKCELQDIYIVGGGNRE